MSQATLNVQRIIVDQNNLKGPQIYIVCASSKYNAKGAFAMSMTQATNMAHQAGLTNVQQLIRNCKGGKLSFEAEFVKEGQEWVNTKTGEAGKYTKDHWKLTGYSFELSPEKAFVLEAAASSSFADMFGSIATGGQTDMIAEEPAIEEEEEEELQVVAPVIEQQA
jgi:hypothetical protein